MRDFGRGFAATLPLAPGVVAFGMLYGVMARQVGFSPWEAWVMSLAVHAGAAQFSAVGMWTAAGAVQIILTTLIINLRHLLMGASVAPYLRGLGNGWKAFLALWMTDESYALAMAAYGRGLGSHWYFLGANAGIYVIWGTSGLAGALLGRSIPDPTRFGLDLVFPLAFMGLLVTFLKSREGVAVAVCTAVMALPVARVLPGKWYVVVAGLLGSALGVALEEVSRAWRKQSSSAGWRS